MKFSHPGSVLSTLRMIVGGYTLFPIQLVVVTFALLAEEPAQPLNDMGTTLLAVGASIFFGGMVMKGVILKEKMKSIGTEGELSEFLQIYLAAHIVSLSLKCAAVMTVFCVSYLFHDPSYVLVAAAIVVALSVSDLPSMKKLKDAAPRHLQSEFNK